MLPFFLQKIALAGLKRSPLNESVTQWLQQLGVSEKTENPTKLALDALSAGFLAGNVVVQPSDVVPKMDAPAPAESLKVCPPAALDCLQQIVTSPQLFPIFKEFLEACLQKKVLFPPEALPIFFEEWERRNEHFIRWLPVLGERARWLASQHPEWHVFFENRHFEWKTARHGRDHFLKNLRDTNPAAATEILLSTWSTESPVQKNHFLKIFQHQLGTHDLPLLEIATSDRSVIIRRLGWALAAQIPDSALQSEMLLFFKNKLQTAIFSDKIAEKLVETLPHLDDPDTAKWVALLDPPTVSKDWRQGVAVLIVGWLPPPFWGVELNDALQLWEKQPIGQSILIENLLENLARRAAVPEILTFFNFFKNKKDHPIWQSNVWCSALDALPNAAWQAQIFDLMKIWGDEFFEKKYQILHKQMRDGTQIWSREMLIFYFRWLKNYLSGNFSWEIDAGFIRVFLRKTAFNCRVEDVDLLQVFLNAHQNHHFLAEDAQKLLHVANFRRRMWQAFEGSAG